MDFLKKHRGNQLTRTGISVTGLILLFLIVFTDILAGSLDSIPIVNLTFAGIIYAVSAVSIIIVLEKGNRAIESVEDQSDLPENLDEKLRIDLFQARKDRLNSIAIYALVLIPLILLVTFFSVLSVLEFFGTGLVSETEIYLAGVFVLVALLLPALIVPGTLPIPYVLEEKKEKEKTEKQKKNSVANLVSNPVIILLLFISIVTGGGVFAGLLSDLGFTSDKSSSGKLSSEIASLDKEIALLIEDVEDLDDFMKSQEGGKKLDSIIEKISSIEADIARIQSESGDLRIEISRIHSDLSREISSLKAGED